MSGCLKGPVCWLFQQLGSDPIRSDTRPLMRVCSSLFKRYITKMLNCSRCRITMSFKDHLQSVVLLLLVSFVAYPICILDHRIRSIGNYTFPRTSAVTPVRESSRMPYGLSSSIMASILSVSPTT